MGVGVEETVVVVVGFAVVVVDFVVVVVVVDFIVVGVDVGVVVDEGGRAAPPQALTRYI